MMVRKLTVYMLVAMLTCTVANAQIQRRNSSPLPKNSTSRAKKSEVKEHVRENNPVIIAIDDGMVYVDRPGANIKNGDAFEVMAASKVFTHPTTGKKIRVGNESIAMLIVVGIHADYIECEVSPESALPQLKPGMQVTLIE